MGRVVVVLTLAVTAVATACGTRNSTADRPRTVATIVDAAGADAPDSSATTALAPDELTGRGETPGSETSAGETPDEGTAPDGPNRQPPDALIEPEIEPSTGLAWAPTDLDASDADAAAWKVEILDRRPHDPSAFTQGLEIHEGALYESTGEFGESSIRLVEADTGEVVRSLAIDPEVFGEGLTVVDDHAIQLTWQAGVAYLRDLTTFGVVAEFGYEGEGWGLCHDDTRLIMSDGSAELEFRDPTTFDVVGSVPVSHLGEPVALLNELECVDGYVLANVFRTDAIAVIDPTGGDVVATIDASALTLDAVGGNDGRRVLNGIARLDETTFLLTGKDWPAMYRVRLVPA